MFNLGVFKREFGLKALQQYLWCELVLKVQQAPRLWYECHHLVTHRVWNCSSYGIRGKLVEIAAKIKEVSKLLSVVRDWLEFDEKLVDTPAFSNLTQVFARQHLPSIQCMRTSDITQDASLENCVENLNLSSGDGLQTIIGNDLWRKHGPQTLA